MVVIIAFRRALLEQAAVPAHPVPGDAPTGPKPDRHRTERFLPVE
jgi:hypothetical protein